MIQAEPFDALRRRSSEKWCAHPDDVLPLFVAEMDYPLFEPIQHRLMELIRASDTGYAGDPGELPEAFAGFAERRWDWRVDPAEVRTTTDVSVVVVESLRRLIRPGDGVVICPPVYPPFFDLPVEAGGRVVEVPLLREGTDWSLDIDGIRAAFTEGARALLLCHPHNPLGLVHPAEQLAAIADAAAEHGAWVVSDEIHAPLVHPGTTFAPFLTVSPEARAVGVAAHSASKAFNLAGLKTALFVTAPGPASDALAGLPVEVRFRTAITGRESSIVAFRDGDAWLDELLETLLASRELLARLLTERLPSAVLHPSSASYLAWIELPGFGLDPAARILKTARVALSNGPAFGAGGDGFARLNFACSPELLTEAIARVATAH